VIELFTVRSAPRLGSLMTMSAVVEQVLVVPVEGWRGQCCRLKRQQFERSYQFDDKISRS
jgi:hypothetical protein